MAKQYKRSKTTNKFAVKLTNSALGKRSMQTKFTKTLVVRGIGYRAFVIDNNFLRSRLPVNLEVSTLRPLYSDIEQNSLHDINQVSTFEFTNKKYVLIRAGHTRDLCIPLQSHVSAITSKKDRKLVIAANNNTAANLAKYIYDYRPPSVYTGRGVRMKHAKPVRKAGKKDKQKGRAF